MFKIYVTSRLSLFVGFYSTTRLSTYRMTLMETELLYRMQRCMAKWEKKRVHDRI